MAPPIEDGEESLSGAPPKEYPWYHLTFEEKAAMVGALGGITFGYDIGVISGALVSLTEDFELDANAEGGCLRWASNVLLFESLNPVFVGGVGEFDHSISPCSLRCFLLLATAGPRNPPPSALRPGRARGGHDRPGADARGRCGWLRGGCLRS